MHCGAIFLGNLWSVTELVEFVAITPHSSPTRAGRRLRPCVTGDQIARWPVQEAKTARAGDGRARRSCFDFVVPADEAGSLDPVNLLRLAWSGSRYRELCNAQTEAIATICRGPQLQSGCEARDVDGWQSGGDTPAVRTDNPSNSFELIEPPRVCLAPCQTLQGDCPKHP